MALLVSVHELNLCKPKNARSSKFTLKADSDHDPRIRFLWPTSFVCSRWPIFLQKLLSRNKNASTSCHQSLPCLLNALPATLWNQDSMILFLLLCTVPVLVASWFNQTMLSFLCRILCALFKLHLGGLIQMQWWNLLLLVTPISPGLDLYVILKLSFLMYADICRASSCDRLYTLLSVFTPIDRM